MTRDMADGQIECARIMRKWTERHPKPDRKALRKVAFDLALAAWRERWRNSAEYAKCNDVARECGLLGDLPRKRPLEAPDPISAVHTLPDPKASKGTANAEAGGP